MIPPSLSSVAGRCFVFERRGEEFFARWIGPIAIFPCEGVRDMVSEAALAAAFKKGGWKRVTRLYRNNEIPEDRCWLRTPTWALTYN
jgi:protein-L-isoaspartate(D-aspartate) O-methyltransferase